MPSTMPRHFPTPPAAPARYLSTPRAAALVGVPRADVERAAAAGELASRVQRNALEVSWPGLILYARQRSLQLARGVLCVGLDPDLYRALARELSARRLCPAAADCPFVAGLLVRPGLAVAVTARRPEWAGSQDALARRVGGRLLVVKGKKADAAAMAERALDLVLGMGE